MEALEKLIDHLLTLKVLCSLNFCALHSYEELVNLFYVFLTWNVCFILCVIG